MDPTATLKRIREICEQGNAIDLAELIDLVEALDQWMTRGGFLPTQWQTSFRA
jgi:hypothetical protein